MSIVEFEFDKEKDLKNIWKAVNFKTPFVDFSKSLRPELVRLAREKDFQKCAKDIEKFNQNIYESDAMHAFPEILNKSWAKIEEQFIERLEEITRKKFKSSKIKGYITTIPKCPYNPREKWFMVNIFNSILGCMLTTAHELFHIHLHNHFLELLKFEVGEEKAHDIKEAITTSLLNLEFRDLWIVEDRGYEKHEKLRKIIEQEWIRSHDFYLVLDRCSEIAKKITD